MAGTDELYAEKGAAYFSGARRDIVDRLNTGAEGHILEIGCGDGSTGELVLKSNKAGHYVGVELFPAAAKIAADRLSRVFEGNVETLDLGLPSASFDALIASEVLEHLIDPWGVLAKLGTLVKPGGQLFISSPNISSRHVIAGLLKGRFEYTPSGIMDQSHLRWFTPTSFARMAEMAGFEVVRSDPLNVLTKKARIINAVTGHRFAHLFTNQIFIEGCKR
jgi:2-polyprenyl-3-methyl-5-hydroxy-6-metoxy-1,4-benzoquinol methylase